MANTFVQASSDNLPNVDAFMVAAFLSSNVCYSSTEFRGVKEASSGRESYGDAAIGFVELNRNGNVCTVRCKMTPEHKIKSTSYTVVLTVDEEKKIILSVECQGCVASSGGCKHSIAFMMWVHRRSEEPSRTSVENYWKKPRLANIKSNKESITVKDFGLVPEPAIMNASFLDEVIMEAKKRNMHGPLLEVYSDDNMFKNIDIHILGLDFKTSGQASFSLFMKDKMNGPLITAVEVGTRNQSNSRLWHQCRYARITASKLYSVAHSKKGDGVVLEQILGTYKLRETEALQRGRHLEAAVKKVLAKNKEILINDCGIYLSEKHPIFGASPDGVTDEYVIEIKCPSQQKTFNTYLTKKNTITSRYNAQVQLQMLFAEKKKALFCVADPQFEKNEKITVIEVPFDEDLLKQLMEKAETFWLQNVLPVVLQ